MSIERVDLVNSSGDIVQQSVSRSEAEGLMTEDLHIPIIISVISNTEGEVLVHERAAQKRFGGQIDNVCGAIETGETPYEAALRETMEEVGVVPVEQRIVRKGVNVYGYYCYLFYATCDDEPQNANPREVAWARYIPVDELRGAQETGAMIFVDDFFTDLDCALASLAS